MTPLIASTQVVAQSQAVLARHGRSFSWASAFLPPQGRDDAAVLYAVCRLADDLADELPPDEASEELAKLQLELEGKRTPRPVVAAFLEISEQRGSPLRAMQHLVETVRSDLTFERCDDDRDLVRYCYGVAGTVGLLMCGVLGVADRDAHRFAIDLGIGMQLTNICRDVREDAALGRVYLPADRLRAAGTSPEALLAATAEPSAVAEVVSDLLDLADRYYESGITGMRYIPVRSRVAILVASQVYRAIGRRLRRRHACDPLVGRTVVPPLEKLFWTVQALLRGAAPRVLGLGAAPIHDSTLHRHLHGLEGAGPS